MNTRFIRFTAYEGEGDGGGEVKFTPEQQAKLNQLLAAEKRANQAKIAQLTETIKNFSGTTEELTALKAKTEELEASLRTKEEQAAFELNKTKKEADEATKRLTGDRDQWRTRYTDAEISRAITDAASTHQAFNPSQVLAMLKPTTRLVEENGRFNVKVKLTVPNDKGEQVELDLTPNDAVKRMTEMTETYGNLFRNTKSGGTGGSNTSGGTKLSLAELARNPELYRKMRAEGKLPTE